MGNKLGIGNACAQIGTVYSNQGDYKRGLQFLTRALDLHTKLGSRKSMELDYLSMGNIYIKCGEYKKALEFNKKAFKLHGLGRTRKQ